MVFAGVHQGRCRDRARQVGGEERAGKGKEGGLLSATNKRQWLYVAFARYSQLGHAVKHSNRVTDTYVCHRRIVWNSGGGLCLTLYLISPTRTVAASPIGRGTHTCNDAHSLNGPVSLHGGSQSDTELG